MFHPVSLKYDPAMAELSSVQQRAAHSGLNLYHQQEITI